MIGETWVRHFWPVINDVEIHANYEIKLVQEFRETDIEPAEQVWIYVGGSAQTKDHWPDFDWDLLNDLARQNAKEEGVIQ